MDRTYYSFDGLKNFDIHPVNARNTKFLVTFKFKKDDDTGKPASVEFDVSAGGLMILMRYLQEIQRAYTLPIPQKLRRVGKPKLTIVRDKTP